MGSGGVSLAFELSFCFFVSGEPRAVVCLNGVWSRLAVRLLGRSRSVVGVLTPLLCFLYSLCRSKV